MFTNVYAEFKNIVEKYAEVCVGCVEFFGVFSDR